MRVRNLTRETTLGDRIEVADSSSKRRAGLLGRTGLEPGEGLWITPCEAVHCFFMKFAIDVVFLDRKKKVRKVTKGLRPWRVSASLLAHSTLELPVGTIDASRTEPGDQLEFEKA